MPEMYDEIYLRSPASFLTIYFDLLLETVTESFFDLVGHCFGSPTKFLCRQIFKVYEYKSFQENSR